MSLPSEPITRKEQYLAKAAGQAVEIPAEPITREEAYLDAIAKGSGGGGGTSDYSQLSNKPQINDTTLTGNKTASQLGLVAAVDGKGLSTNDYTDADKAIVGGVTVALAGKQNVLTAGSNIKIDNNNISVNRWFVPAGKVVYTIITSDENYGQNVHIQRHTLDGSFIDDRTFTVGAYATVDIDDFIRIWNPYSEFRITLLKDSDEQQAGYMYVVNPISKATSTSFTFMLAQEENDNDLIIRSELDEKQDTLTFDDVPTANSDNPVKSGGVKSAIDAAVSSAYHHAGTKTCVELVAGLLVAGNEGNVYNMTDSGTTTSDFIEGAGQPIKAGDNVGVCKVSDGVYKFDLLSGFVDTSNFVQKSVTAGLIKNDGTIDTVEKQPKTDNNLTTTSKDTTGAINELRSGLTNKQDKTDNTLTTTEKTVVGAINEVASGLTDIFNRTGILAWGNYGDGDHTTQTMVAGRMYYIELGANGRYTHLCFMRVFANDSIITIPIPSQSNDSYIRLIFKDNHTVNVYLNNTTEQLRSITMFDNVRIVN